MSCVLNVLKNNGANTGVSVDYRDSTAKRQIGFIAVCLLPYYITYLFNSTFLLICLFSSYLV